MKCEDFKEIDFIENWLESDLRKQHQSHYDQCEKCRKVVESVQSDMGQIKWNLLKATESIPEDQGFPLETLQSVDLSKLSEPLKALRQNYEDSYKFSLETGQKIVDCIVDLKKSISANPKDPVLLYKLAKAHEIQGSIGEAIQCMLGVIKIEPDMPGLYAELGYFYILEDQWDRVKEIALKAISLDADHPDANCLLGYYYYMKKKYTTAESKWLETLQFKSDHHLAAHGLTLISQIEKPDANFNRNIISNKLKQFSDSFKENPVFSNRLGDYYLSSHDSKLAIASYKEADNISTNIGKASEMPLRESGQLLTRDDIVALEDFLLMNPEDINCRIDLGIAYSMSSHIDQAIYHWEMVLKKQTDIKNIKLLYNLGRAYLKVERENEAKECFDKVVEYDKELKSTLVDDAYGGLGELFYQKGNIMEAITHYQRAIEIEPEEADYRIDLGEILLKEKRPEDAIEHLKKAVQLEPANAEGFYHLCKAHLQKRDFRSALESIKKAIKIEQDNYEFYKLLAVIYGEFNLQYRKEEAERTAYELEPKIGIVHVPAILPQQDKGIINVIECTAQTGKEDFIINGNLGKELISTIETVKECLNANYEKLNIPPLNQCDIFLDIRNPELISDGPSIGLGIFVALWSALRKKKISPQYVFTGDLTIQGEILRVGNILEKIETAIKYGKRKIFIPGANMQEIEADIAGMKNNKLNEFKKRIGIEGIASIDQLIETLK